MDPANVGNANVQLARRSAREAKKNGAEELRPKRLPAGATRSSECRTGSHKLSVLAGEARGPSRWLWS